MNASRRVSPYKLKTVSSTSFTMSYPKDGVVPFSVTDGMPLTGVYNYTPNPDGPVVTPKNGYFEITRAPKTAANQATMFSITTSKPVAGGCVFQFNVRYNTIQVLPFRHEIARHIDDKLLLLWRDMAAVARGAMS